jgi:phosphoribosylamine--glycine ligase
VNFLVLGSGAREHALVAKLNSSPLVDKISIWPGNAYTRERFATLETPPTASWRDAIDEALRQHVDVVVIGPEQYLAEGVVDYCEDVGIAAFGPNRDAAQLECSKAFAKHMMEKAKVPTAAFEIVHEREVCLKHALQRIHDKGGVVIKASGLAAGKGVFVCFTEDEVKEAVERLYETMAVAAEIIVLEDILVGREVSFFCMLGKAEPHILGFAVDHKRLRDNDEGPNTGGMGCYTPVPWLPDDAAEQIMQKVVHPLLKTLADDHIHYGGWLYVGLMWTKDGPSVVEFNVRLGDPEAQVLAESDPTDWAALICNALQHGHIERPAEVSQRLASVGVVLASAGYPYGDGEKAGESLDVGDIEDDDAKVFTASVKQNGHDIITGSGRVLTVVGSADDLASARRIAYARVEAIKRNFKHARYRSDIGKNIE